VELVPRVAENSNIENKPLIPLPSVDGPSQRRLVGDRVDEKMFEPILKDRGITARYTSYKKEPNQ